MRRRLAAVLLPLLLAGCTVSEDHLGHGAAGPSRCDMVWRLGAVLPKPYLGCMPAVKAMGRDDGGLPIICADGRLLIVRNHEEWAFPGGVVGSFLGNGQVAFRHAARSCVTNAPHTEAGWGRFI